MPDSQITNILVVGIGGQGVMTATEILAEAAIALELGDMRLGNTVMLGAMADHLPFPASVLLESVLKRFRAKKPQMVEVNQKAFEAGRAADKAAAHGKHAAREATEA